MSYNISCISNAYYDSPITIWSLSDETGENECYYSGFQRRILSSAYAGFHIESDLSADRNDPGG